MQLPEPRGPISASVLDALSGPPPGKALEVRIHDDALAGDDFHLALYVCYELHYAAIDGVDPAWEWDPALISLRGRLERAFETALRQLVPVGKESPSEVIDAVLEAIAADDGPSLSRFIEEKADVAQVREFVIHRSAYQLKEADPHSWAIPRLRTPAKAALVEIQSDEYGGGRADRIHSVLFAGSMRALGLDPTYGHYISELPGITLATVNLMSMFGLNRRFLGCVIGHLATFESTSSEPNGRYARGLRRLGIQGATPFFDEHVEADSMHETIAIHDLLGTFVRDDPVRAPDVVWGARCLLALERAWAEHLLAAWATGRSSLLPHRATVR